jgi:hypothetical protein
MKGTSGFAITKTERVYLILFSGFISLVNSLNLLIVLLEKVYNPPPFEVYVFERASQFPVGRFLSFFILAFVVFGRRHIAALAWTLLCLLPFTYEFAKAYQFIYYDIDFTNQTPALAVFRMIANPLDYLGFLLLILLFVWLTTVVVRSYTLKESESEK